ncbi:UDP-N-acetylmuramoyl-L-alanine--D-glutamate ligase [Dolichospermum sp. ST_sed1]|nr:UDP-N-acetylmuramoyl-L-alanine--D-glutamate ligase [Dolichospermum sp. ST_sed1]MDD1424212.1 UDP-N-acetylmuramoyl-L-alanine--D-glutamate ligase [Dolichospermum sp. ST_sed9]MDD1430586.1 UDP-N-acetylmuramoyl-L-alanine--D-glutamate ligase [Dolichospermum sp. ST_sed6]MDD1435083.1 UDP-N-acetylmuramoyl-L-alanine--D-glutamate ligase [Dolichospermum sp. ST_sed10]MDD1439768.1 UDP-N-acetylmuramoyl-L-alanine--D-glutamate ligase [Dolichospermum sp. ST_sed3]MDD1448601.1 UDP-N-acetylmuramoyl-L-alanine--D-
MPEALIIGFGKSGVAAARLLKQEGWEVELCDSSTSPTLLEQQQKLASEQITVKLGNTPEFTNSDISKLIVVSPGVPWDIPILAKAREIGIETIGEMELAWRFMQDIPWVGITGTNGKTTTTALTAAIFQTAGLNAPACGNIGYAACEVAQATKKPDWIIGELSSYQIESSVTLAPRIGIWTTFTPDHLARHKTLENYYNIKAKLLHNSQIQIFNGDDAYLSKLGLNHWPNAYWTSVKGQEFLIGEKGFYIENGWVMEKITPTPQPIVEVSALRMVGEHNQQNLLMSVAAARLAGIDITAISQAVREFPGVPHRLEHICNWQGIDFINDSKATNYDAAEVGLASVQSPAILIAGGEAKAGDDNAWLAQIQAKAAAVLLIGNAAPAFAKRLQEVGYSNYHIVETMENAVSMSAELAKKHQASVVLLSPACASFDQYPNFEMRGEDFRQLCQKYLLT